MLHGNIQEQPIVGCGVCQPERRRRADDQLGTAVEIERPSHARRDQGDESVSPAALGSGRFNPGADPFEHQVRIARQGENSTGAQVVVPKVAARGGRSVGKIGGPCVAMHKPPPAQRGAAGKVDLITDGVLAQTARCVARWQYEAESGREGPQRIFIEPAW